MSCEFMCSFLKHPSAFCATGQFSTFDLSLLLIAFARAALRDEDWLQQAFAADRA